jgi:hypothetical protein
MKLKIEIEFGNDAMQTYGEAVYVINEALARRAELAPKVGDYGSLFDVNGNYVGTWIVRK